MNSSVRQSLKVFLDHGSSEEVPFGNISRLTPYVLDIEVLLQDKESIEGSHISLILKTDTDVGSFDTLVFTGIVTQVLEVTLRGKVVHCRLQAEGSASYAMRKTLLQVSKETVSMEELAVGAVQTETQATLKIPATQFVYQELLKKEHTIPSQVITAMIETAAHYDAPGLADRLEGLIQEYDKLQEVRNIGEQEDQYLLVLEFAPEEDMETTQAQTEKHVIVVNTTLLKTLLKGFYSDIARGFSPRKLPSNTDPLITMILNFMLFSKYRAIRYAVSSFNTLMTEFSESDSLSNQLLQDIKTGIDSLDDVYSDLIQSLTFFKLDDVSKTVDAPIGLNMPYEDAKFIMDRLLIMQGRDVHDTSEQRLEQNRIIERLNSILSNNSFLRSGVTAGTLSYWNTNVIDKVLDIYALTEQTNQTQPFKALETISKRVGMDLVRRQMNQLSADNLWNLLTSFFHPHFMRMDAVFPYTVSKNPRYSSILLHTQNKALIAPTLLCPIPSYITKDVFEPSKVIRQTDFIFIVRDALVRSIAGEGQDTPPLIYDYRKNELVPIKDIGDINKENYLNSFYKTPQLTTLQIDPALVAGLVQHKDITRSKDTLTLRSATEQQTFNPFDFILDRFRDRVARLGALIWTSDESPTPRALLPTDVKELMPEPGFTELASLFAQVVNNSDRLQTRFNKVQLGTACLASYWAINAYKMLRANFDTHSKVAEDLGEFFPTGRDPEFTLVSKETLLEQNLWNTMEAYGLSRGRRSVGDPHEAGRLQGLGNLFREFCPQEKITYPSDPMFYPYLETLHEVEGKILNPRDGTAEYNQPSMKGLQVDKYFIFMRRHSTQAPLLSRPSERAVVKEYLRRLESGTITRSKAERIIKDGTAWEDWIVSNPEDRQDSLRACYRLFRNILDVTSEEAGEITYRVMVVGGYSGVGAIATPYAQRKDLAVSPRILAPIVDACFQHGNVAWHRFIRWCDDLKLTPEQRGRAPNYEVYVPDEDKAYWSKLGKECGNFGEVLARITADISASPVREPAIAGALERYRLYVIVMATNFSHGFVRGRYKDILKFMRNGSSGSIPSVERNTEELQRSLESFYKLLPSATNDTYYRASLHVAQTFLGYELAEEDLQDLVAQRISSRVSFGDPLIVAESLLNKVGLQEGDYPIKMAMLNKNKEPSYRTYNIDLSLSEESEPNVWISVDLEKPPTEELNIRFTPESSEILRRKGYRRVTTVSGGRISRDVDEFATEKLDSLREKTRTYLSFLIWALHAYDLIRGKTSAGDILIVPELKRIFSDKFETIQGLKGVPDVVAGLHLLTISLRGEALEEPLFYPYVSQLIGATIADINLVLTIPRTSTSELEDTVAQTFKVLPFTFDIDPEDEHIPKALSFSESKIDVEDESSSIQGYKIDVDSIVSETAEYLWDNKFVPPDSLPEAVDRFRLFASGVRGRIVWAETIELDLFIISKGVLLQLMTYWAQRSGTDLPPSRGLSRRYSDLLNRTTKFLFDVEYEVDRVVTRFQTVPPQPDGFTFKLDDKFNKNAVLESISRIWDDPNFERMIRQTIPVETIRHPVITAANRVRSAKRGGILVKVDLIGQYSPGVEAPFPIQDIRIIYSLEDNNG